MNLSADVNGSQSSWLDVLQEQVSSLRFGVVQIVVHERRVVQIEKTEKIRFDSIEAQGSVPSRRPARES